MCETYHKSIAFAPPSRPPNHVNQEKVDTYTAQVAQQEERKDEPFRHSTRLNSARTELATVSRRLLSRYADPGTVERLDAVLGSHPPGTACMDHP